MPVRRSRSVPLARARKGDIRIVLALIGVDDRVAFVVVALRDQPAEDPGWLYRAWFGDPRSRVLAVHGRDVVARYGAPVRLARLLVGPAFDSGKEALGTRPVPVDPVRRRADRPVRLGRPEHRHKVLRTREDEDIRLLAVSIPRQALVGLAGDRRHRQAPAVPEDPVARARVVGERQLWPKTRASRTDRHGYGHRSGSRDGIRTELLTDAADRPTALR